MDLRGYTGHGKLTAFPVVSLGDTRIHAVGDPQIAVVAVSDAVAAADRLVVLGAQRRARRDPWDVKNGFK